MSKLIFLFAFPLSFSTFSQSEIVSICSYCTSLEDALVKPEEVIHLNLSATGLLEIPSELGEFTNLKTLDLSQNLINRIDFSSFHLKQLQELNLSNNPGFDAFQMDHINASLPNLESLNLSQCNLIFLSEQLSLLKKLEQLDVSNNDLRFLPNNLNQLRYLDASKNDLQDAFVFIDSWKLAYLNVSGNDDLALDDLVGALTYKESLQKLTITPDATRDKSLPSALAEISLQELTLNGGKLSDPNFQIPKNDSIRSIILENVEISDPVRFKNWINRFAFLERLEFRDMQVPEFLDEIVSADVIHFKNATFADKMELRKIKPSIQIEAKLTDIRTDGFIGNTKIAVLDDQVAETRCSMPASSEMLENRVEPIVTARPKITTLDSSKPARVEMEFTEFDIPSEAFLTQSGQIYTGEVRVEVTEYMDPIINALAGVPMTFNTEKEDIIFSSSGMFDFRAYDDENNELKPNPENPIDVKMNDLIPSENSQLYAFNDSINNWEELPISPEQNGSLDRKKAILDSLNQISDLAITNFYVLPVATLFQYKKSRKDPYEINFRTLGTRKKLKRTRKYTDMLQTNDPDQRWVASQSWKIDTLVDVELLGILEDMKQAQRKTKRKWYTGLFHRNSLTAPRFVKNLAVQPDLANDNYRMTFTFKGENVSLPVVRDFAGTVRTVQSKEKRAYQAYLKKMKIADKERKNITRFEQTVLADQAAVIREREATLGALMPDPGRNSREFLRFGLDGLPRRNGNLAGVGQAIIGGVVGILSFGLINCDRPLQIPLEQIRMDEIAFDQNGEKIEVPPSVRIIYVQNGGYVSAPSVSVPLPRMRKSIVMFPVNERELAVVRKWEKLANGKERATLDRFSIEGLSPGEIRELIVGE